MHAWLQQLGDMRSFGLLWMWFEFFMGEYGYGMEI